MQLIENTDSDSQLITAVNAQAIYINKVEHLQSCIVCNQNTITDLNLSDIAELNQQHIEYLLTDNPEIVILGSGIGHVFPDVALLSPIAELNIGFEVMNNQSAARTYNVLIAEERKVACLLIL